jgi:hypothetical protein
MRPGIHPDASAPQAAATTKELIMAKLTAPLLSFGGAGQLAKSMVYASWKGIPYARRYVIPANPRTTAQQVTRNMFKSLNQIWLLMPGIGKEPWLARAQGKPLTGVNAFIQSNIRGVDTAAPPTDWADFIGSAGAKGGLPPASLGITPAATTLTCAVGAPAIPTGWTIEEAQGICFLDGDPQAPFEGTVQAQFDATSTYSLVFTGLVTATDYVVSVWFKWNRPDGTFAYSTSITDLATTS